MSRVMQAGFRACKIKGGTALFLLFLLWAVTGIPLTSSEQVMLSGKGHSSQRIDKNRIFQIDACLNFSLPVTWMHSLDNLRPLLQNHFSRIIILLTVMKHYTKILPVYAFPQSTQKGKKT